MKRINDKKKISELSVIFKKLLIKLS